MNQNKRPHWNVASRTGVLLGVACMAALFVGCGPEPHVDENRTSVSGVVTFKGEPLRAGKIRFESKESAIGTAASIGNDGHYATNRVPLGESIVTIETESLQYGSPHLYTKIPERYSDPSRSDLSVEVSPGENENVNFELEP